MIKVLLVDDDPEEVDLMSQALERLKFRAEVIHADHYLNLTESLSEQKPDIIFMDINMPAVSGIDCLKSVRSNKTYENIPVIMYSTSNNHADVENSFKHKASLYVVKPDSFTKLISALEKVFSFDWNISGVIQRDTFLIA